MSNSASTLKRILVPLDVSEYAEAATQRACQLSQVNQSNVTGMVVLDTPEITGVHLPAHPVHLLDYTKERIDARTAEAEQAIQDELAKFAHRCEQAQVAHHEAAFQGSLSPNQSYQTGQTARYYLHYSRLADNCN